MGSEESSTSDCHWRFTAASSRFPRIRRPGRDCAEGREDRGVKKRPSLRGVTEGRRLSLWRVDLTGDESKASLGR